MKIKFYIIIGILLLSTSSTVSNNKAPSTDIYSTNIYSDNMIVEYVDVDTDGLFDEIQFTMEIDLKEATQIEANINLYSIDEDNYYNSYDGIYQIVDAANAGIQNITISFANDFYNTYYNGTMNFEIYLYTYDSVNYNNEFIGDFYASKDFNYKDFKLPVIYFDYDNIEVLYFDRDTNQSVSINDTVNSVDTIILRINVTQTLYGQFSINANMRIRNAYDYTNFYGETITNNYKNSVGGNYTSEIYFSTYGFNNITYGEPLEISISVYTDFGYYVGANYDSVFFKTNYKILDEISPNLFEGKIIQFEFIEIKSLDRDNSGFIDTFEVIFLANFSKAVEMGIWVSISFYDVNSNLNYEDNYIDLSSNNYIKEQYNNGSYNISMNMDTSRLYGKNVPENYNLNINFYYNLVNQTNEIWDYKYWDDQTMVHAEYDKPDLYIASVEIFPSSNNEGAPEFDYLEIKINVESKIYVNLNLYIRLEGVTETYWGWEAQSLTDFGYSEDISVGNSSLSYFVNAKDLYETEFTGDLGIALDFSYFTGDYYNSSDYVYDYKKTLFKGFDYNDYNPSGRHPDDPNYDPDDDSGVLITETSEVDVQLPTLNLPAPSLYITLMGIFSMIFVFRKRINHLK